VRKIAYSLFMVILTLAAMIIVIVHKDIFFIALSGIALGIWIALLVEAGTGAVPKLNKEGGRRR